MKMKNNIKYIILLIIAIIWISFIWDSFASYEIEGSVLIEKESMNIISNTDPIESIEIIWFNILGIIKLALEWILVIFIVYIWAQMIWSMWSDEEALSKSKKQIMYSVIAVLFINMPWDLYLSFHKDIPWNVWNKMNTWWFLNNLGESNMFFDAFNFWYTFWDQIVWFLSVLISAIAIVMIVYEALKLISSRWREEKVTEAKNKVVYSILALVFVWIIQIWKSFAFSFKVSEITNIFSNLADLALFFAWPIAFFFLTIAAYYYITSAWDEEKVKKAKSIVINTVLATLILLAAYTFLLDLANL